MIEASTHYFNTLKNTLKAQIDDEHISYIQDNVDTHIDELRKIAYQSDGLLLHYQQELITKSWCNNLKIKFVTNSGYLIEVTPKDIKQFESIITPQETKYDLHRTQTLKSGQRYSSSHLEQLQQDILKAQGQLIDKEMAILLQLQAQLIQLYPNIIELCEYVAQLDIYTSHTRLIQQKNLIQPKILPYQSSKENITKIIWWRHLVIEHFLPHQESFIANDLIIGTKHNNQHGFLHIITWPNMGGKSTYLRQNALIILLAHTWLFVPAQQADITLVDAIFARVWSGDNITHNQSTFMTEMIQVANILHNATPQSFIIFDELGRGTSTYDGLALSKAILEYIITRLQTNTLLATHYHELIQLEKKFQAVKNYSVSVYETDKEVVFLKKIVAWWADKSYGLEVARLAGIPPHIIQRAKQYLQTLEDTTSKQKQTKDTAETTTNFHQDNPLFVPLTTPSFHDRQCNKIKSLLDSFDLNNITPMQSLQILEKIKNQLH